MMSTGNSSVPRLSNSLRSAIIKPEERADVCGVMSTDQTPNHGGFRIDPDTQRRIEARAAHITPIAVSVPLLAPR
jgi:hypothetical protein